jgi:Asp-tRNA(Asn)/Glu-tRNA(Gln) amidotransferase A subunit family amidase
MPKPLDATRRHFLAVTTAAGLGHTLLPGALLALASSASAQKAPAKASDTKPGSAEEKLAPITIEMIEQAAMIAGVSFTAAQRKVMIDSLTGQRDDIVEVRKLALPNAVAPALVFNPVPGGTKLDTARKPAKLGPAPKIVYAEFSSSPAALEAAAFLSVRELGQLLRKRKVTSTQLTRMYIDRLKRLDAQLHCVITLTEERALKQAALADSEMAGGRYRGPLHGIPWGGKDLLAVAGYPTTWGAAGFEKQSFDYDAEVVKRLDMAGAVLIAKLSMGALAQGDLWFGGRTRNPWNTKQGSSGSSAGSASAVAAGCVGFAIGTETLGSISSPSTRCGVTGLRPSYGLVPRTGAMALTWSMDKIGPIARSVEDAALVLAAIYGPDGHDLAVQNAAFNPDFTMDVHKLRVGYLKSSFEPAFTPLKPPSETLAGKELEAYNARVARNKAGWERQQYDSAFDKRALGVFQSMGLNLIAKEMPKFPFGALVPLLEAEAAAAFDELTRSGRDALLTGQQPFDWPNQFRSARLYPAVDYIQAVRARTLAVKEMTELFADIDVLVTPSGGTQLTATNLTGQPAVIVPNGFRGADAPPSPNQEDGAVNNAGGPGTPVSLTFLAPLYQEAKACAMAHAYQVKTGFHLQHPKLG